jgi:hypothetical protein
MVRQVEYFYRTIKYSYSQNDYSIILDSPIELSNKTIGKIQPQSKVAQLPNRGILPIEKLKEGGSNIPIVILKGDVKSWA